MAGRSSQRKCQAYQWKGSSMQVLRTDKCHCRHVSINHPEGAKYCKTCNDYVLVDSWHKCTCCGNKVQRETKSLNAYKRFEDVIAQNEPLINCYLKNRYKCQNMPGFVISIDWRTYLVSMEYVAEFAEMPRTRDPTKIKPLLEKIQEHAPIIYPGTRIN